MVRSRRLLAAAMALAATVAGPAADRADGGVTGRTGWTGAGGVSRHAGLAAEPAAALAARAGVGAADLALERLVPLPGGGGLRLYRQSYRGLPVIGATGAARLDRRGRIRWLAWTARPLPADLDLRPRLSAREAARRAAAALGHRAAAPAWRVRLAVWAPPLRRARLAWSVDLAADLAARSAPRAWIDAKGGALLAADDHLFAAAPRADVFEVSPAVTPVLSRVELAELAEGAERLASGALEALGCPDTRSCREVYPDTHYHACELAPLAAPDGAGDFLYPFEGDTAPDDPLAEVMAFYQASKGLAAARALGMPELGDTVRLVANFTLYNTNSIEDCRDGRYDGDEALRAFNNAFFTLDGQSLGPDHTGPHVVLGQGNAVDYALDGDVVQHELGHAVMADLAPELGRAILDRYGTDMSPAGLHEGYADLLTVMVTGDPVIGEYIGTGRVDGAPLRDLREPARCPDDVIGEAHADSRPFTAGMWRARERVAAGDPARARAFDRAVMAGWIALGDAAGYQRASALTVAELEVELGAAAAEEARLVLEEHGLTGCGDRVVDGAAGVRRSALPGLPDLEAGGVMPGPFQLRAALDRRAGAIEIEVAIYDADTTDPALRRAVALLKPGGAPIEWREADGGPAADHTAEVELVIGPDRRARAVFEGPHPPGTYHLMLASAGVAAELHEVRVQVRALAADDGGCSAAAGAGPRIPALLGAALVLLWLRRGRRRPAGAAARLSRRAATRGRRRARATPR